MADETRKPFWKRKRWIAAAVVWLVIPALYAMSFVPASYAVGRNRIRPSFVEFWYWPLVKSSQLIGQWRSLESLHYIWRDRGEADASL